MCDKRDRAVAWVFCRDLHLTLLFLFFFFFEIKLLSSSSHKVYRILSSSALLRKLTTISTNDNVRQ